ncbi:MAG: hypothetical protein CML29_05890 [Rhizobiales bacterium]|nr:hypothetical protein [Hyphomicrobiales bacterium]MBA68376.1 hypothetical protein [Hyphomicrobiales bacterium]
MARGKPIPALMQPIQTPRFELRPASRFQMFRMYRRAMADPELRGSLLLEVREPGLRKAWKRMKGTNGRTRFCHAIIDKASGEAVGYHYIKILNYRTAAPEVMIFDKNWWGKGAVIEIRKALYVALYDHASIEQITAQVHSRNFASILNHRKMGMEQSGTIYLAKYDEVRDEPADFVLLSLRGEKLREKIEEWRHERG